MVRAMLKKTDAPPKDPLLRNAGEPIEGWLTPREIEASQKEVQAELLRAEQEKQKFRYDPLD